MPRHSTHLSSSGTTTVPKELRDRLQLTGGARLRWTLLDDGTLRVVIAHRYGQRAHEQSTTAAVATSSAQERPPCMSHAASSLSSSLSSDSTFLDPSSQ